MTQNRRSPAGLRPREVAEAVIRTAELPAGAGERFTGYAIMGLPFASGHYLAFRHFPATSIGQGYLTVWHRTPAGTWTIYADSPPHLSCARYLATGPVGTETAPITVSWTGSHSMRVQVGDWVNWDLTLGSSPATRLMSRVSGLLPAAAWRNTTVLTAIGHVAGPVLGVGRMRLHGTVPSGQRFQISPQRLWTVTESHATIKGENAGPPRALPRQDRFGDLWMPQRGLFVATTARFESHNLASHAPLPSLNPSAPTISKEH